YSADALRNVGGFATGKASVCEDVTIARALAAAGHLTGFHEGGALAETEMYQDWRDALVNWTRSLPMRDAFVDRAALFGLAEATLTQALPLPLMLLTRRTGGPAAAVNRVLLAARIGVLAGTARAYPGRPISYWLSPLADLAVIAQLWRSALRRSHTWRGRTIVRDHTGRTP
ncbi:MAG: glycosyltransferase family 2 protein, partial [Thermomicrobiales bacterium]